ncbi:MAG: hypothetical protein Q9185_004250 [Variospora sp. 1 TL-2023]
MDCRSDIDASAHSSLRISTDHHNHPYALSIESSASSSTSSVFSLDAPSSQSSVSSTSTSWESEQDNVYLQNHAASRQPIQYAHPQGSTLPAAFPAKLRPAHHLQFNPVASECRQHPRRTLPQSQLNGCPTAAGPRPPPALVRQSERRDNFVEGLVDTTTQMIETIWPLSVISCGRDTTIEGKNQNLIGLRTFVQEVLRRSKTSHSTLQVALYYLVLIQSCLPKHDFTMEQREDTPGCRAMQCGRRMFLASLILASKYLQDRNFSARAWSKISGLRACEINANEMAFLTAVNWKLHIPEPVFQRWTDVVYKYSPSASSLSSPRSSPGAIDSWKAIVPRLTPDLDDIDFGHAQLSNEGLSKTSTDYVPAVNFKEPVWSRSNDPTPIPPAKIPKTLEPTPRATHINENILPALPRLGPLPTPKLTPQPNGFNSTFSTPAVGADGLCPRRSSMSIAMEQAQKACTARTTLDNPVPSWRPMLPQPFPTSARRSSMAFSNSSGSSPESMVSDVSSRSSRSSSISSVASSACALPPGRPGGLAAQATRRCANMQMDGIKKCRASVEPNILRSNDQNTWDAIMAGKTVSASPQSSPVYIACNDLQAEAKATATAAQLSVINCTASAHEAATALRDLALNQQRGLPQPVARPTKSRKRDRPLSMDLSGSVQGCVQDMVAPRSLADITNGNRRNEDDSTVLPDGQVADSFLVPRPGGHQAARGVENKPKPMLAKDGPRKRMCGNQEAQRIGRLVSERAMQPGPGMWDGII